MERIDDLSGPEGLVVTQASLDDWPVIKGWAADEGWDPGEWDGVGFFAQDPESFFLGRIDGEPVSAISVVNYGADYAFLGCYFVRPDLRGRGYGLTTWKTALAHADGRTVGLDGVVAQQGNYRQSGFEPAYKTFRFGGVPAAGKPGTGVRPAEPADFEAITAYDSACYPADRTRFVERWLTGPGHRALVRVVDGRPVAVDIPETSTVGVALAEEHGLTPSFETARMYTGPRPPSRHGPGPRNHDAGTRLGGVSKVPHGTHGARHALSPHRPKAQVRPVRGLSSGTPRARTGHRGHHTGLSKHPLVPVTSLLAPRARLGRRGLVAVAEQP